MPPFSCSEISRLPDELTQQPYNSFTQFKETAAIQRTMTPPRCKSFLPVEEIVYFNFEMIVKCPQNMGHLEFHSIRFTCWITEAEYILSNIWFLKEVYWNFLPKVCFLYSFKIIIKSLTVIEHINSHHLLQLSHYPSVLEICIFSFYTLETGVQISCFMIY